MTTAARVIILVGAVSAAPILATSIARVELGALFREADVVAHVYISSGQTECHDSAMFKAEVLTPFKGVTSGDTLYFGPFSGYRVGWEYVVFLRDSGSTLLDHQKTEAPKPCSHYSPDARYLTIMYEGYSILPINYTIEIPDGDHGVQVTNAQVILPDSLESFPLTWKYAGARDERWVRKADMLKHLGKLARSFKRNGGNR